MPRIRLRHAELPKSLTGWIAVNDLGVPRLWATVWADILLCGVADSTRGSHLAAVETLYQSAAEQAGDDCLDAVIAALDFDELEAVLGGFLAKLRNESAIEGIDREKTWQTALRFVGDVVNHIGRADGAAFADVQARLLRLNVLYGQLAPKADRPPAPIRALPGAVIEDLYEIFSPDSTRNPFRSESARWRNHLIFLLMLHMGLRRSEVLILPADAVKDDFDLATGEVRYWINITENPYADVDPRSQAPNIKTTPSRRQLPLSQELLHLTDLYVQNYRGKPAHSFLFNSQKQAPLAAQSLADVFTSVTACLSPRARKALSDRGKAGVEGHDLRHTAAVVRLTRYMEHGNDLNTAMGKLRRFFGWSITSKMPRHYAAAYFETRLAEVWNESFDCFVDTLRDLAGEEWQEDFGRRAS
jgi:Phage integrase family.